MDSRYKKHPPRKYILQVIEVTKLSDAKFEMFFGMHQLSISYFRRGVSLIPKKYWHLFYDPPQTLREIIEKHNTSARKVHSGVIVIPKIHKKRQRKKQEVKKIGVLEKLLT